MSKRWRYLLDKGERRHEKNFWKNDLFEIEAVFKRG
jgi:hypothetical protein